MTAGDVHQEVIYAVIYAYLMALDKMTMRVDVSWGLLLRAIHAFVSIYWEYVNLCIPNDLDKMAVCVDVSWGFSVEGKHVYVFTWNMEMLCILNGPRKDDSVCRCQLGLALEGNTCICKYLLGICKYAYLMI